MKVAIALAVVCAASGCSSGHDSEASRATLRDKACFIFYVSVPRAPTESAARSRLSEARAAALAAHDVPLANDVTATETEPKDVGSLAQLEAPLKRTLDRCKAEGWRVTDPCHFGVTICGTGATSTSMSS